MSKERLQILNMVQEGKVSAEEAEKLLEALEQPGAQPAAPRAKHLRLQITEGSKVKNFSVGMGLARWALSIPGMFEFESGPEGRRFDNKALQEAMANGGLGRVFEATEGNKRLEIWLDE